MAVRSSLILAVGVACAISTVVQADGDAVDFDREIRSLLSDRCYACHGPDPATREAELRLDTREGAFGARAGGAPAIVPGRLEASELWRRITSDDPGERMPPAELGRPLTDAEIEKIRRWIETGAQWKEHWAFRAVGDVPVPAVNDTTWPRQPIDHFVLSRLEREGLRPGRQAERERLLRRVSLDLTGLPPAPEVIDAFLADESPGAYERAVDALMASPAYGERMAIDWLDVARFADTYGYQSDRDNRNWPWRDWVIRNFNDNLPYDDFIVWQVAGDLLPEATREQVLATTFHRNHRQTNEGGSINEEFRVEYNADRVKTTAMAFLGLTFECARCHEHKYDPITQEDYYRFFAFFNSTDESGLYSHFTDAIPSPTLLLYADDVEEERHRAIINRTRVLEEAVAARRVEASEDFARWVSEEAGAGGARAPVGHYSFDTIEAGEDGQKERVPNLAGPEHPGTLVDSPRSVEGRLGRALLLDGENSVTFAEIADFRRPDPFSLALWLRIPREEMDVDLLHQTKAGSDAGSRGYEVRLAGGRASLALIHFWPGNAVTAETTERLAVGEWIHLGVTYDGSSRAAGLRIYVDGEAAETRVVRDQLFKDITYEKAPPLRLGARMRGPGFKDGEVDDLKVFDVELSPLEMAEVARPGALQAATELARRRTAGSAGDSALYEFFLAAADPEMRRLRRELHQARVEENDLVTEVPEIMVLGDLPERRPTYLLERGQYDAHGVEVEPQMPASILPFDPALPKNRLGLARWLVTPRNPLPARVTVNRYWQLFFGRGIVATPEDFGSQGERPSHPALLDWLARWFVENEWDVKALHRLMVTSATYRQSSAATPEKVAGDPHNALLARGPSHRLSAELIRDNALHASGLLDRAVGGRSVKMPGASVRPAEEGDEKDDEDEDPVFRGYRRGLYVFVKRSMTSPYLLTFDATGREDCITRRQVTNTPLQALVILNDPLFHEIARTLARRAREAVGDDVAGQIDFMFRRLTGRAPLGEERQILEALFREQLALFRQEPRNAAALLGLGPAENPGANSTGERDPALLAAAAVVAKAVLGFDETFTKR